MKKITSLVVCILIAFLVYAQKNMPKAVNEYEHIDKLVLMVGDSLAITTDGLARYIRANFKTETEKTRAAFYWIAHSIEYDAENMFAINFYEKREEKVSKALRTRKGICENYAALFQEVCTKAGIRSLVVEGYTKQNGFTEYIPHAWCAALVDSSWFLFDPTWGSGYISDGKFYRKINNAYFKVRPEVMIRSHMPFDYLWQFLNYRVSNQEFYEGRTSVQSDKPFFDYADTLEWYLVLPRTQQLASSARRVEENGVKNSMIFDWLRHLKLAMEEDRRSQVIQLYNDASKDYNEALLDINNFIRYRNEQFEPIKSDGEIQAMVDIPANKLTDAKRKLDEIQQANDNEGPLIAQLQKAIVDVMTQVTQQKRFVTEYLSKGRAGRRSMFYRTTIFGFPVD